MIQTLTYTPGILKDYVCCFAIREFDPIEEELLKPMHAKHEIHMMLMINSKMHDFKNSADNQQVYSVNRNTEADCVFSGLLTSMKGSIVFKGHVKLLTIHFKPTGFFRLFGISPSAITNCLGNASDLFSKDITRLHEQLHEVETSMDMFCLTEEFLIDKLSGQKAKYESCSIFKASEFLLNQSGTFSIEQLAYHTNMSLKTFERKFIEQVGLAPKLFERIRRFNAALDMKMFQPKLSWTNICHQTGYYDQMHFIKDFTAFAGKPPSAFFKNTPPPSENISTV